MTEPTPNINPPKEVAPYKPPLLELPDNALAMIERLAKDPNADIDKLERIMRLHEAIVQRNEMRLYSAAMAAMQPHLPIIPERGKIQIERGGVRVGKPQGYALWEDTNELIKPVLAKYGFSLTFQTNVKAEAGLVTVTGVLRHDGGASVQTEIELPLDLTGSKNKVQSIGSSISYGKRYTAAALLNLTSRGEDDDAQGAGSPLISPEQVDQLQTLIVEVGADIPRFLKFMRIEKLEDLPADKLEIATAELERKRAKGSKDVPVS